jgi:Leu/Phe-tRNA-protein transferase
MNSTNPMTLDEQIAILQALKEGKKIEAYERKSYGAHGWMPWDKDSPCNFYVFDYRIVPEPRRFVIYKSKAHGLRAMPYEHLVPHDETIICTATEDTNLGETATPYLEALKEKISRP